MKAALDNKSGNRLYPFPKIIVIIPDDDLIKVFTDPVGIAEPIGHVINFVMTEHDRCIAAYKEYLPAKCLRCDYPQLL